MVDLVWFLLGFWVGGSAGFLLFACVQASRDPELGIAEFVNRVYENARR